MRTKATPLIILGVLAVLLIAYVRSITPNFRHRAELNTIVATLKSVPLDRVDSAARSFVHDRKTKDNTVALGELLSGGYLKPGDVGGLADKEVAVSVAADVKTPQMILIRVRASDGSYIVLMGDGSIQQMPPR